MTQSSLHALAFYRESLSSGAVWTIRDAGGYPAPANADGKRAQPFWSSETRAQKVIDSVQAYAGFEAEEITLDAFVKRWLVGLARDGILVGLNWSGSRASGYDLEAHEVLRNLAAAKNGSPR